MRILIAVFCTLPLLGCSGFSDAMDAQQETSDNEKEAAQNEKARHDRIVKRKEEVNVGEKGIIGKMTDEVVDMHKAMAENPELIIVENKAKGDDPLSFYASAYIAVRSQASQLGMQQQLQHIKILEERNPTYDEFVGIMKSNRIQFSKLPYYRMYGYDEKEGKIVVLEDPALKPE
jgi:hypothetical protein